MVSVGEKLLIESCLLGLRSISYKDYVKPWARVDSDLGRSLRRMRQSCVNHVLAVEVDFCSGGRGTNQLPVVRCGVPGAGGVANTARGTVSALRGIRSARVPYRGTWAQPQPKTYYCTAIS